MKYIANTITALRIPLAVVMLLATPFSVLFWGVYLSSGLTDILDGFVARTLNQESQFGAKLDSAADLFFAVCVAIFVIVNIAIPIWLWLCILSIAVLRLSSYGIGFYKYHTLASLHTYANKFTGLLIFVSPISYRIFGLTFMGIAVCIVALLSTIEELVITTKSKVLMRDCKSIFVR